MLRASLVLAGARAMSTVKVGGPVPAFKAVTHTGAAVSSESLAGTSYCLWFYPRADTGGSLPASAQRSRSRSRTRS